MGIIRDFLDWVVAVLRAWHGWLSSSAIAALIGYAQALDAWHPSRKTYIAILTLGFLVSIFEAWRKEHKLAGSSKPDFRLEIRQSVQHFEKDTGYTLVFLGLRIINAGIDSAILEYSAHYKDEHFDEDCQLLALANKVIKLRMPNNSFFVMDPKDALNRRSPDKVIPKGGFVSGRLVFRVTGNRCDAIADGRAVITVKIQDYLGTEYREEFRGTGKKETPMYMPGEPLAEGVLRPKDFRKIKRDRN